MNDIKKQAKEHLNNVLIVKGDLYKVIYCGWDKSRWSSSYVNLSLKAKQFLLQCRCESDRSELNLDFLNKPVKDLSKDELLDWHMALGYIEKGLKQIEEAGNCDMEIKGKSS